MFSLFSILADLIGIHEVFQILMECKIYSFGAFDIKMYFSTENTNKYIPLLLLAVFSAKVFAAKEPAGQLEMTEPGPGDMAVADGNSYKRALKTSRVSSFSIDVTFVNSINLANNTAVDITFDGSSGPVGTFTVYSPPPGETAFFHFCLPAAGETSITTGSDMEDTVLIVVRTMA